MSPQKRKLRLAAPVSPIFELYRPPQFANLDSLGLRYRVSSEYTLGSLVVYSPPPDYLFGTWESSAGLLQRRALLSAGDPRLHSSNISHDCQFIAHSRCPSPCALRGVPKKTGVVVVAAPASHADFVHNTHETFRSFHPSPEATTAALYLIARRCFFWSFPYLWASFLHLELFYSRVSPQVSYSPLQQLSAFCFGACCVSGRRRSISRVSGVAFLQLGSISECHVPLIRN